MDATCTIQDSIHVFSLVHKYVSRILGTYQTSSFKSYRVKVTDPALNIRAGAGTNYKVNGMITDMGVYTIIAEKSGTGAKKWGRLKSKAGWIALDYTRKI